MQCHTKAKFNDFQPVMLQKDIFRPPVKMTVDVAAVSDIRRTKIKSRAGPLSEV